MTGIELKTRSPAERLHQIRLADEAAIDLWSGLQPDHLEGDLMSDNIVMQSAQLQVALDRLITRQRECVLLHLYEGASYQDIALQKKLTRRIVLRDLTRGYASMRCQLGLPQIAGALFTAG